MPFYNTVGVERNINIIKIRIFKTYLQQLKCLCLTQFYQYISIGSINSSILKTPILEEVSENKV